MNRSLAFSLITILATSLLVGACSSDDTGAPAADAALPSIDATADAGASAADAAPPSIDATVSPMPNRCNAPLVRLRTGPNSECAGGNEHRWPIGLAATDCHGWRAVDTEGSQHDNSANGIVCNADGSFSFTQYPGNLACTGTGNLKTYSLNVCEQDTPPRLYTIALDLTCCSNPDSAECRVGAPSVTVPGGAVFLNGTSCAE